MPIKTQQIQRTESGATLVEFCLVIGLIVLLIVAIIDLSFSLYRMKSLSSLTTDLTRHLSTELGNGLSSGVIAAPPWDGSCGDFAEETAKNFLANKPFEVSIDDTNAFYYLGKTIDEGSLLLGGGRGSSFLIIRVEGQMKPACLFCQIVPPVFLRSESSALLEYSSNGCNDY